MSNADNATTSISHSSSTGIAFRVFLSPPPHVSMARMWTSVPSPMLPNPGSRKEDYILSNSRLTETIILLISLSQIKLTDRRMGKWCIFRPRWTIPSGSVEGGGGYHMDSETEAINNNGAGIRPLQVVSLTRS